MQADLNLAVSAGLKLARRFRVVGDDDMQDLLPQMPRHLRLEALDRLRHDGVLRCRNGGVGFSSTIYDGCVDERRSGDDLLDWRHLELSEPEQVAQPQLPACLDLRPAMESMTIAGLSIC